jgi:hypothetical protein
VLRAPSLARAAALAALGAPALLAAACGEPTRIKAQFPTVADTLTVYALTGTPVTAPTALNTYFHSAVRAEAESAFDVAFDIDTGGRALIYPAQLVGANSRRAGVLKSTAAFDSLLRAPDSGYNEDAATPIAPGDVVVIRANVVPCAADFRREVYSKLRIDSVNVSARTIHFRMRVDPNCGFRDFTEGVPRG